jgi:hypothetical protein
MKSLLRSGRAPAKMLLKRLRRVLFDRIWRSSTPSKSPSCREKQHSPPTVTLKGVSEDFSEEVVSIILEYPVAVAEDKRDAQRTLATRALVSRFWYCATVTRLYLATQLDEDSIDPFVYTLRHETGTPSIPLRDVDLRMMVKRVEVNTDSCQPSFEAISEILKCRSGLLEYFAAIISIFGYVFAAPIGESQDSLC